MTPVIQWLNHAGDLWWPFVLHAAWQGALVGLLVLAIVNLGRRLPAPVRHGLLLLALAKFLVPPLLPLPCGLLSQLQAPTRRAVQPTESVVTALAAQLHIPSLHRDYGRLT